MVTLAEELSDWASGTRLEAVPDRVAGLAKSQILSQLAAIRAGLAHPLGGRLVRAFGPPLQSDPRGSARVLAGLGSWLNLDDTAYAGHLSVSTVAVPLAYAHALGLDGRALLTAVVTANECAARLTAAATLGPFRGQTAAHTSLVGGVAGRLRAQGAPAGRWADAFALALSMPPWTLFPAYIGSDARALGALLPVGMAMDACDAAEAGFGGLRDVIEHDDGFLARFATVPLPEVTTAGLGSRWHTDTLSFKVRPGGPGIDAAVDCALDLYRELGLGAGGVAVAEVVVEASLYTVQVDRASRPYLAGPDTPAGALPLSMAYAVATALLHGDLTTADFRAPAVREDARWALAERVRLVHDERMTRELFSSVAPFGEALRQAGERAKEWTDRFTSAAGPGAVTPVPAQPADPAGSLEGATKLTPARVTVRLVDGRTAVRERGIPVGGAGAETARSHPELMRAKFLAQGGDPETAAVFAELERASAAELGDALRAALARDPGAGTGEADGAR
ncbi:MmgE/PrpD family protein [Streptomyces puniciscabiei]|uniref:MmgE/PrpD family protein n=1 Tax=Streptomyces puniciscabiei TaxID=164348 RepID=UPI001F2CEE15|nr:MmgE/PrpD family protein [Streptomyces puniciscabiei]